MKPIIGISSSIDDDGTVTMLCPYGSSIEKAGGIPILLPYVEDCSVLEKYVEMCDGFLFSGGFDIAPSRYGEATKETCGKLQPMRDKLEFTIFEKIIKTDKPIMGICRGFQFINVALGGTLIQDIPSEAPSEINHTQTEPRFTPSHEVRVLADTPLYSLVGKDRMVANSFHHQAIKTLGRGLKVMAMADDGIVEAIYSTGERYIRAYQWHPERLYKINEDNLTLFSDFIRACRK